jgi:2-hydroxyglutarate dehydrogenase
VALTVSAIAPPTRSDIAIIGGGIIGLALARELCTRHPRATLSVLEREREVGTHQTSHNSGVVHAGVYYRPGSLKARLCVEGARELYDYCDRRGIDTRRTGKLILASDPSELPRLRELERRGRANGVEGLRLIEGAEVAAIEPHARGVAALHSPTTGVVDYSAVARAYAEDVLELGGEIATACGVTAVRREARSLTLVHDRGTTRVRYALFCAGAWADRLAILAGASADPRIVPMRGAYLRLKAGRAHLVRSMLYPVPDPRFPFLGVHLTKQTDGQVLLGPTALIAPARDAYSLRTIRRRDLRETLSWPGTWRLIGSAWPAGLRELRLAVSRRHFVAAAQRYVPDLRAEDVEGAFAGVRAQALARDGKLLDDFVFSATEHALHVRNAPSPAATASLAIARRIGDRASAAFDLTS